MSALYNNAHNNHNDSLKFYKDPLDISSISLISKSKFAEHFYFLCKKCESVPILEFTNNKKLRFLCKCKESPRILSIKNIFHLLYITQNYLI